MPITLDTRCHLTVPGEAKPVWTGTLNDFWAANQEQWPTWRDFNDAIVSTIAQRGFAPIGGGAVASATLVAIPAGR